MAVSFEQLNTGDFATDQDVDAVKNNLVAAINELVERINDQDTYIDDFDQRLDNEKKTG